MQFGIIGLPNVGKSTLFNTLTHCKAEVANYPFCTIDANVGIVSIADDRLDFLQKIFKPSKVVPTTIEFVDIAGLVKGASKGEGLGNQFLAKIREVDAIIHIVRLFKDNDVSYVYSDIDAVRDIQIIKSELALADLETLKKKMVSIEKRIKGMDKDAPKEKEFFSSIDKKLNNLEPIAVTAETKEEKKWLKESFLLSSKPVLYVANVDEDFFKENKEESFTKLETFAKQEKTNAVPISAKIEMEITDLSKEDAKSFYDEMGIKESGLTNLVNASYGLLELRTFFTGNENEVHAWTVAAGTAAVQAAGKVHSDMEKGFVKAEVINYKGLVKYGSIAAAREKGVLGVEGKDYIVCDGDVIYFKFTK